MTSKRYYALTVLLIINLIFTFVLLTQVGERTDTASPVVPIIVLKDSIFEDGPVTILEKDRRSFTPILYEASNGGGTVFFFEHEVERK